jgi:hypothetical protein
MLNFGVSGYSTDNELRAYLHRVRRYRPDAVIAFVYVGNDVLENGARLFIKNSHGLPPKPWLHAAHSSGVLAGCLAIERMAAHIGPHIPTLIWSASRIVRFATTQGVQVPLHIACTNAAGPDVTPGVPELFGVFAAPPRRSPGPRAGARRNASC